MYKSPHVYLSQLLRAAWFGAARTQHAQASLHDTDLFQGIIPIVANNIGNHHHCDWSQEAFGKTWVLYDMALFAAMLICLITYSIYIHSLVDFQPEGTYEVYDSLGGAQARLLLPKKQDPSTYNGESQLQQAVPDKPRTSIH